MSKPQHEGFYWFDGCYAANGKWTLVQVFRPLWVDPHRKDLHWRYLDGSGDNSLEGGGNWSERIDPPDQELPDRGSVLRGMKKRKVDRGYRRIGIVEPYEACEGRVSWTVQELDEEGEPLSIIAECKNRALAKHLLKWIRADRERVGK